MKKEDLLNFNHLKEIETGYFKHLLRASSMSMMLFIGCTAGIVHSFFPFLFVNVMSLISKKVLNSHGYNIK